MPKDEKRNLTDRIVVTDRLNIIARRAGTIVAHRSAGSSGPSTATDVDGDQVSYRIRGSAAQGEQGNLQVASMLRQVLNARGGQWGEPIDVAGDSRAASDVDVRMIDGPDELKIQITRAEQRIWPILARTHQAGFAISIAECADRLLDAIMHKSMRIPPQQRQSLVLALNAIDAPAAALPQVLNDFERRHGLTIAALGFASVWLVGPTTDLTIPLA